jgi:hypothetical protein
MLCHSLEEKEKQRPVSSTTLSPIFGSVSLSFQPQGRSEEVMGCRVRGHRIAQGQSLAF